MKAELLAPVGNIDCLKAAIQNGADSIYLGASTFNARASAKNFNIPALQKAIEYSKVRNVKVFLALNTLIKNNEFNMAVDLPKKAYEFGVDAIIVQDLGLASYLIKNFPDLPIHASTQMTINNLEGALELQKLGFKRVILSRELSLEEIDFIARNSKIELECFIHGALCISYSGQCLFSSMVGGRSGNRGKCAAPCRLPYELIKKDNDIFIYKDKGYLLSPRDLYGLECIPELIKSGVSCFKIEGRLKNPEYVATVTRIYRKYIDLALSEQNYKINIQDKKDLQQIFNRGDLGTGHFKTEPNKNLIYKETSSNTGVYIGSISNFNSNKGHITLKLTEPVSLKDRICIRSKTSNNLISNYTITELMKNNANIPFANSKEIVKIGRMKGNIKSGDKIYKIESKNLLDTAFQTFSNDIELKKIKLEGTITLKKGETILFNVKSKENGFYKNINISVVSNVLPEVATNSPLTKDRVIAQLEKTTNTPYVFEKLNINLEDNLYIPNLISTLNDLRRTALTELENVIIKKYTRTSSVNYSNQYIHKTTKNANSTPLVSLLLNVLNPDYDYSNLKDIDNVYIPLRYWSVNKYEKILQDLSNKFNLYIYLPTVVKPNYINLSKISINKALSQYNIKGFVISNIGNLELLKDYIKDNKYSIISNYSFNIFNNITTDYLSKFNLSSITISPELSKLKIEELCNNTNINKELIVYGATPLMNCSYCLLGNTNKCYPECDMPCKKDTYYLKDRLDLLFRIIIDNLQTVTTIYNSKITSIEYKGLNIDSVRIDILDENVEEINKIINIVKSGKKIQGKDFTNGNFSREV